jgi:hypothetical protein
MNRPPISPWKEWNNAMIELSKEQVLIQMRCSRPKTREEYVLIRREGYERQRRLLDENFTAEDAFRAQIESAAIAGWDDPALDIYNLEQTDGCKHYRD